MAKLFTLVTATIFVLAALTNPAWAGAPQVKVEVIPTSVELPFQGESEVLVVVQNTNTDQLYDVRLSYFAHAEVDVKVEAPSSTVLVPYGALAWTIRLSRVEEGPVTGTVHLRVDYIWEGGSEVGAVPCVSYGSLKVKAHKPEATENVADVQVKTALTSLMERRPSIVYLVVTNKYDVPLQVTGILPSGPEGVMFTLSEPVAGVGLAPGGVHAFPVKVEATRTALLGKHLLVFEIAFEWEKAGRKSTGNIISTHEVEIGIVGESGILTALGLATVGVPSFLVLPGFLMLMTVVLLWRLSGLKKEFPLKDKAKPEFWFVAITLSLLTTLIYPVITGWLGDSRDFLKGYGLSDVMWVWFASIIFAAVAYIAVTGGVNLYTQTIEWYRDREARQQTPLLDDDPIRILQKLDRQGLSAWRDRVKIKIEEETLYAYLLQSEVEGMERIWVGPRIVAVWKRGVDPELRQKVEEQLGDNGDAALLGTLLEKGMRPGGPILEIGWETRGRFHRPYEARIEDLEWTVDPEKRQKIRPNSIVFLEDFVEEDK